ncbi:MAG: outer membrane protein assembly factor BamA [Sphaerochaetaceae bacterium]|nr:outer membrane protein assembly factor BamA [Sphaerochaetaceae bacterium]
MKKKLVLFILVLFLAAASLFAAEETLTGLPVKGFAVTRTKNVSVAAINNVLYSFREEPYSEDLLKKMIDELYEIPGVSKVASEASLDDNGTGVKIAFTVTEYPVFDTVKFFGNSKVKKSDLTTAAEEIVKTGEFISTPVSSVVTTLKEKITTLYNKKGFSEIPIDVKIIEDEEKGTVAFEVTITEGIQSRIVDIQFEGNENVAASVLKKQIKSTVKGLFTSGYLNIDTVISDYQSIARYYMTVGFIDVSLEEPRIEEIEDDNAKYRDVKLTFVIKEGTKWNYGGMTFSGNSVFSDDQIKSLLTVKEGSVLNLEAVQNQVSSVAELYYDNGYIMVGIDVSETRNEETNTVSYNMVITEGAQSTIEKINITGLENTKEYVMRRELQMKEGDIFSRANLVTSAQNLYNTGLLSNLNYNLRAGSAENTVIIDFILEEGSHIDLQFGATFGATVSGFPISGFLQWSEKNLGGRAQKLDVSTTISPTTQKISLAFGDSWFNNIRWSNNISLNLSRVIYSGELQKGIGSDFYDGRSVNLTYPLGYSSAEAWEASNYKYPSSAYLMSYQLYTLGLAYNTGYTYVFNAGRLSLTGGLSISLNHAVYEDYFTPYEKLIYQYGQKTGGFLNTGWQFSNSFTVGATWDGRDYVNNTTKGYVASANATYAGGFLGGLSNYIKGSVSLSGYLKLFEVGPEEAKKNIMLCATTSASIMLPQYYYNAEDGGWGWHDPKTGATKYEMLYIDGMTIARGFSSMTDKYFLWDNMLEVSYPLAENIINAEVFASATGVTDTYGFSDGMDWYFAAGAGLKLKISGFPLGLYLVKNFKCVDGQFENVTGAIFGQMNLVLAISTSLI